MVPAEAWELLRATIAFSPGIKRNCNLRMGWTFPRYRKVRYHYQHRRSVQVLAWNTAYLGHTSSGKMNSSWNGYRERLIETERRGELILQRRLGVLGEQGQERLSSSALSDKDMGVEKEQFELEDNAG